MRKGQNETFPLTNKTVLDPLNLEIQIRQDLSQQTKPQLKEYVLGDAKGLQPLKFTVDGVEKLKPLWRNRSLKSNPVFIILLIDKPSFG